MSDKVGIPRTMSGAIGVADVTNAIKRKFLTYDLDDTTGRHLGNATVAGYIFQRNMTFEKMTLNYHAAGTTTNTAKFRVRIMKNASVAAVAGIYGTAVLHCTTTGWKRKEITPTISAFTNADRLWIDTTHHTNGQTRISVTLEFREALDS
jgi:hypothetical protein